MEYHKPVLLNEVLDALNVKKGGKYIDCTLGDGGHTLEILKRGGLVLGLDVYKDGLERATKRIEGAGLLTNFVGAIANFTTIFETANKHGFSSVDGILFDLGYSSYQLDETDIGLSFLSDQPLDMRLDRTLGVTAADLVNKLPEKALDQMFWEYSDERFARKFAKEIIQARNLKKFQTTRQLADFLKSVAPLDYEHKRIHPATRVFQALRIAVNMEIDNLKTALPRAAQLLLPGGRMAVITFHSLEDKVVKQFGHSVRPLLQDGFEVSNLALTELYKKPLEPSAEEISENSRSRSAKLRVFERV